MELSIRSIGSDETNFRERSIQNSTLFSHLALIYIQMMSRSWQHVSSRYPFRRACVLCV